MKIKLDILSDPICPWCMIGKAHLDAALQSRPGHPFDIEWHPFQLNPEMPEGGMDRRAYLEAKFGGREAVIDAYEPIAAQADAAGLAIVWENIARTPSTLDAHRLIHWAGLEGRQPAIVSSLFGAYFVEGRDIGDPAVLIDLAASVEMDGELVARLLDSDADREDVRARDAHARGRGVTGVPTFVVGERHVLPGAQPPELWLQVIDELTAKAEP